MIARCDSSADSHNRAFEDLSMGCECTGKESGSSRIGASVPIVQLNQPRPLIQGLAQRREVARVPPLGPIILRTGPAVLCGSGRSKQFEGMLRGALALPSQRTSLSSAGGSPGQGKSDNEGPGSGTLEVLERRVTGKVICIGENASGGKTCSWKIRASVSEDAGDMLLVHIVRTRVREGRKCQSRLCKCEETSFGHVEWMQAGKEKEFWEVYGRNAVYCGCSWRMEGSMFLITTKSPLFEDIAVQLMSKRRRITRVVGVDAHVGGQVVRAGTHYIPGGAAGNDITIETGEWKSTFFSPGDLADLLTDLIDAAKATLVLNCDLAWNCCGGEPESVYDILNPHGSSSPAVVYQQQQ